MMAQLHLGLWSDDEPWEGKSPRVLTYAHNRFKLKARAPLPVRDGFTDPNQLDLFFTAPPKEWRSLFEGAPTLLPLPWEA